RTKRWEEEVLLLQEEMRRVVVYLFWKADWWGGKGRQANKHASPDVRLGLSAYASKQASYCWQLAYSSLKVWTP
ncbi:hypothetical protein DFP72DRAFT_755635, partial [Ephemerocybe angulata]